MIEYESECECKASKSSTCGCEMVVVPEGRPSLKDKVREGDQNPMGPHELNEPDHSQEQTNGFSFDLIVCQMIAKVEIDQRKDMVQALHVQIKHSYVQSSKEKGDKRNEQILQNALFTHL